MASIPSPAELEWQMLHAKDNAVPDLIAANVTCFSLACIAVILRFTARKVAKIKYQADDWLILIGLFFATGVVTTSLLGISLPSVWANAYIGCPGIKYGAGRHVILVKDPVSFAKLLLSAEVIWAFSIVAVKLSILVLYHRIFAFNNRPFTITIWAVGIFVICYCTVSFVSPLCQCIPIQSNWDPTVHHHCVNIGLGATVTSCINVLTDFLLIIIPMPPLYKMQRPLKQKLSVMGIFLLGGLVCFASIYRTILTHQISFTDPTWSDVRVDIWTIVELTIGIVSACLPTLRPLFNRSKYTSKYNLGSGSGKTAGEKGSAQDRTGRSLTRQQTNSASEFVSTPSTPDTPEAVHREKRTSELGVLGDLDEAPEEQV